MYDLGRKTLYLQSFTICKWACESPAVILLPKPLTGTKVNKNTLGCIILPKLLYFINKNKTL
jgi:hypothetical protein